MLGKLFTELPNRTFITRFHLVLYQERPTSFWVRRRDYLSTGDAFSVFQSSWTRMHILLVLWINTCVCVCVCVCVLGRIYVCICVCVCSCWFVYLRRPLVVSPKIQRSLKSHAVFFLLHTIYEGKGSYMPAPISSLQSCDS